MITTLTYHPEKPDQGPTTYHATSSQSQPLATEKHRDNPTRNSYSRSHSRSRSSSPSPPPPHYAIFARADIKSRLPRPFLDRSLHLITLITFIQIFLGITTGIVSSPPFISPYYIMNHTYLSFCISVLCSNYV